jgi:hypothetical protein
MNLNLDSYINFLQGILKEIFLKENYISWTNFY